MEQTEVKTSTETFRDTAAIGIIMCRHDTKGIQTLLIQEPDKAPPGQKPKWKFPCGKTHEGETLEDALTREMEEESGIDMDMVRSVEKIGIENRGSHDQHIYLIEARPEALRAVDRTIRYGDEGEALHLKVFTMDEVGQLGDELLYSHRKIIKKYFGGGKTT